MMERVVFARSVGAPIGLQAIGIGEADLARAASIASTQARPNPRPIDRSAVEALLRAAFEGRRPGA